MLFYLNKQCFNCILVQNYVVLINTQDKKKKYQSTCPLTLFIISLKRTKGDYL